MADMIMDVKQTVTREIDKKVKANYIPDLVGDFLKGPWKEVMKIIGLRDCCDGKAWYAAVRVIDDMIWSVQPKTILKERRQLLALIPKLLPALREGLLLIGYEQEEINTFFKHLEKIHVSCIRPAQRNVASVVHTAANKNQAHFLQEITRQSDKHQAFQTDISDPVLSNSHYFQAVQSMPLGTWVEFKDHQGVKRGKLAWKCDFTGEFTFLDRLYKVIADVPMRDLIRQMEYGKARIINEMPLLERAVDAVINGMKYYTGRDSTPVRLTS
jgi:hypothetical protein